ncbi:MAG: hypothetical protein ABI243_09425 [Lapillicoccus sp.]
MRRDEELAGLPALVHGQYAVVAREQVLGLGMTARQVEWRLTSGAWVRLHRSVYLTQPGREDRLMRLSAAILACGDGAALSYRSAAMEHGLRRDPPELIQILIPGERRVATPDGVRVRRCSEIVERTQERAWPPRTTVEHTVLDVAAEGTADEAIAVAALACQKGLTWDGRLLEVLARRTRHPWRDLLVSALGDIGAGAQSTMEVRYRRDVERPHGQPTGLAQLSRRGGRVQHDVGYDAEKVLIELDGLAFHSDPTARVRDGRRDRGSVVEGWATLRAFWTDVTVTPCDLAVDVGSLLASRGWLGSLRRCRRPACAIGR